MGKNGLPYEVGDRIVHSFYGVGEITGVVERILGEKNTEYYRVEANNSVYYVPVEKADNSRVRPLISEKALEEVLDILEEVPQEMDDDYKERRKRIKTVRSSGDMVMMAELIRDMYFRRHINKLTDAEARALDKIEERLVQEWATCMDIKPAEARQNMEAMIRDQFPQTTAGD
jgi:CarD family transcriptional regulator